MNSNALAARLRRGTAALACGAALFTAPAHAAEPAAAQASPAAAASSAAAGEASSFVAFSQDFAALCVSRNGVQIQVRNTHPTRTVRVWLDRLHMGVGTGDRSRTDLAPGAEAEPLGCSRSLSGPQEWRVVRAVFVD